MIRLGDCTTVDRRSVLALLSALSGTLIAGRTIARPSSSLSAFLSSKFHELVAFSPEQQTLLGLVPAGRTWDDRSEAQQALVHRWWTRSLAELRARFNPATLGGREQTAYRVFEYEASRRAETYRFRHQDYLLGPTWGLQSELPALLLNYQKIGSEADAGAYVERVSRIHEPIRQIIGLIEQRSSRGIILPKAPLNRVHVELQKLLMGHPLAAGSGDHPIASDFKKKVEVAGIPAPASERLEEELNRALIGSFAPAYHELLDLVAAQLKTAPEAAGVGRLPEGRDYYLYRVRLMTSTSSSPDELHDFGLSEVARIHDEMNAIRTEVGFSGSLDAFFEHVRNDPAQHFANDADGRAAYLKEVQSVIDEAFAKLPEITHFKPIAPLHVQRVEPFREADSGRAFYQESTGDGVTPAIYYVNLSDMATMPKFELQALAYHEAVPGHHVQIGTAVEMRDIPQLQRLGAYSAFVEGWGLYAEQLADELGLYRSPLARFGRLSMELLRSARLVVDTGIHWLGWSRARAIDYFEQNLPVEPASAEAEIDRYISYPAQALAYKAGLRAIVALRDKAQAALGEAFDRRLFHDRILETGGVPMSVLAQLIQTWIDAQSGAQHGGA